jgi:hypothetical protein
MRVINQAFNPAFGLFIECPERTMVPRREALDF